MIETELAMQLKKINHRIKKIMQQKIDEYELTFGLFQIIMFIDKNPSASQKEIAKEMKVTEGAISTSIKRLLKLNMIEQIPLESDMRYNRLVLTKVGKSIIDDYKDSLPNIFSEMFNEFNHDELMKLNDFLLRINKNLGDLSN
jgi:DNA-binding MarR family transcriptional regulator